ncbi:MAG: hypothetical protein LBT09_09390 [Planctomycetaceae bacterium]|jgi:endonuclease-3|nr:hypothetical protein [Planctomycetaceae bacterium]
MSTISKTKKIEMLQKSLHRRYRWQSELPERSVLEHLVYAALLENAPAEAATTAYEILESYFIDWNEVRVTTTQELAEIITILPDPNSAADRVRKALRGVFEKTYMFDLEELRKKGKSLSQAIAFLKSLGTLSRFMADYVTQFALGGHVIPVDESAMRVFRMLDLAQVNKERTEESVPGIERAVPKKNGMIFTMELHNFAFLLRTALDSEQNAGEYLSVLKNIDSHAPTRSYTPPALTIPKPQPKERTIIHSPVNIPFCAAVEDEDFDEEHNGTEVEFLPKELHDIETDRSAEGNNLANKNKSKQKAKNKKESPREKINPTNPTTPTPTEIKATTPTKVTTPPTENIVKNIANKNAEAAKTESPNKTATNKVAATTKTIPQPKNIDNPKNNSNPKNLKNPKPIKTTTPEIPPKPPAQKINTTKNNIKQNQKTALAKPQKTIAQKNTKPDKKHDKKVAAQPKINKSADNKPITKTDKKQNEKKVKNNNKKIVNIIPKESKSVTKQLQKKRPK